MSQPRWTIAELGQKVAEALALDAGYGGPANGQVRAVPGERSIRFYTTSGLLDRPAEMRGRTALYGLRHLLQLVAIKRLQAQGCSLAEIQARLAGISSHRLAGIARVPTTVWSSDRSTAEDATPGPSRERFWAALPAEPAPEQEPGAMAHAGAHDHVVEAPVMLASVTLAPGVTLLIEPTRTPTAADAEALCRAAARLIDELTTRALWQVPRAGEDS